MSNISFVSKTHYGTDWPGKTPWFSSEDQSLIFKSRIHNWITTSKWFIFSHS